MSAWQILESVEADFEKMTWTFGLRVNSEVSAGEFAVVPAQEFRDSMDKLQHAEKLLRWLQEKHEALTDDEREKIHRFFDPKPI